MASLLKLLQLGLLIFFASPVSTSTIAGAHSINTRQSNPSPIGSWSYVGCFPDSVSKRILPNEQFLSSGVTVESCIAACGGLQIPAKLAGLEFGGECFCGQTLNGEVTQPDSDCNMPCTANTNELCGGADRISLYFYNNPLETTCASTTASYPSSITATFQDAVGGSTTLSLIADVNVSNTAFITPCGSTSCRSLWPIAFQALEAGLWHVYEDEGPATSTVALAPVSGSAMKFRFNSGTGVGSTAFCAMRATAGATPHIIGANNRSADIFYLCFFPAYGRNFVVYQPVEGGQYTFSTCRRITIQV